MATRPRGAPGGSPTLLLAAFAVFVLVTVDMLAGGPLTRLDRSLSSWARSTGLPGRGWKEPWQRELDQMVNFGDRYVVGLIVVLAFAVVCWRGRTLVPFARLAVLAGVTIGVVMAMKVGFARPAPSGVRGEDLLRSYPSGHTVTAVVLFGLLAGVVAEHPESGLSRDVAWLLSWLAPLVTVVGMVLRDYHWLTDLVAAAALGVVLVQGERLALRHWRGARGSEGAAGPGTPARRAPALRARHRVRG